MLPTVEAKAFSSRKPPFRLILAAVRRPQRAAVLSREVRSAARNRFGEVRTRLLSVRPAQAGHAPALPEQKDRAAAARKGRYPARHGTRWRAGLRSIAARSL
jgi:hypothetical protein